MKKSRSLVAMLMAIVLLLSVSAVSAFAADETVTSVLDFTTLTPGEDFAAVTAAVKGLGAVDCVNLVVGDCYNPTLTGKGYNGEGYFIQKIEAGEGKVFAEAPVVTLNYRITNADPLGYIKVQGSIDGVTYYDGMGEMQRIISGSGVFFGENAFEHFRSLAELFEEKDAGNLEHPVWGIRYCYFTGLELTQEPKDNCVSYKFEFTGALTNGQVPK